MSGPPGVAALGIDLIEIDRVERALGRRPRLADRLFRPAELAACAGRARPARHLAARFAAKEAAIKALEGGCGPRDIEVVADPAPRLQLHGRAAQRAADRGVSLAVSLTHSRDNAAAVVLAGRAPVTA
ncbi:MAG: holo-ACP synthase [Solirubrobacterales bacterium]|nr:holo-ACP synthase [Solirubrobacterales bacterium]